MRKRKPVSDLVSLLAQRGATVCGFLMVIAGALCLCGCAANAQTEFAELEAWFAPDFALLASDLYRSDCVFVGRVRAVGPPSGAAPGWQRVEYDVLRAIHGSCPERRMDVVYPLQQRKSRLQFPEYRRLTHNYFTRGRILIVGVKANAGESGLGEEAGGWLSGGQYSVLTCSPVRERVLRRYLSEFVLEDLLSYQSFTHMVIPDTKEELKYRAERGRSRHSRLERFDTPELEEKLKVMQDLLERTKYIGPP